MGHRKRQQSHAGGNEVSTWIITRNHVPIYRTASYPRFLVAWQMETEREPETLDWTTQYERTPQ